MKFEIVKIDKDGTITFKTITGDNYITYFIIDDKLYLCGGYVNSVKIRKPFGDYKAMNDNKYAIYNYEKDGRKGRLKWCNNEVVEINKYTLLHYKELL